MKDVKPISEWFRQPKCIQCASYGDTLRWLWVAEPVIKEGCYGVGVEVNGSECFNTLEIERIKSLALAELYRRIQCGEKQPEGSNWEVFKWNNGGVELTW